jgi:hypothetical protein
MLGDETDGDHEDSVQKVAYQLRAGSRPSQE